MEIKNRFTGSVLWPGADLDNANLRDADFRYAGLRYADLQRANLRDADLQRADLRDADLRDADLRYADLQGANLRDADLQRANLRDADLRDANLRDADLRDADLPRAGLRYADLQRANLRDADLRDADLQRANLRDANLTNTRGITATEILPRRGEVYGWKKCKGDVLVEIRVPPEAKRSNATTRKCRAEFVEVVAVHGDSPAISSYNPQVEYSVGETVHCHKWDANRWAECSGGIHFFLTREEAEDY